MQRDQKLEFGNVKLRKRDEDEALYFLSGKRLYVVGAQSGEYPPLGWRRPGFLVGKPIEEVGPEQRPVRAAHLLNEMGGIWHQPIKVLDGIYYNLVEKDGRSWPLRNSVSFTGHFTHAEFLFRCDGIQVSRQDFVAEKQPALFSTLSISNHRTSSTEIALELFVPVNLMPAWFTGWANGHDDVYYQEGIVVGYDSLWPDSWAVVFGSLLVPNEHVLSRDAEKAKVTLTYVLNLGVNEVLEVPFLFVAENRHGPNAALRRFKSLSGQETRQLRQKQALYERSVFGGLQFRCSDAEFTDSFYCAKANLELLVADVPTYVGRYFYAGIPEYAQLFGTDTCYAVPGAVATGQAAAVKDALCKLKQLADRQCGRIPHEVTTNGRIFHPGNPQETPQYTIACWSYFRWTGDFAFLSEVYRLCEEGLLDYLVAHWDKDLDFYPDGQSMVERHGADDENVDTVCYFCRALYCLADMADALGYHESARRYRDEFADVLRVSLNHDFWIEDGSIFADSLRANHTPRADGYWTVVVPIETELADPDKAERTLATIEHQDGWLSEYGLVHTRDKEPLVWTLPTGLLAKAAFLCGRPELGLRMLKAIALTTRYGMLGAFEELIPEGLSFIQLWSPALFIQGIVEGVFGIGPVAHLGHVELFVQPPTEWSFAELKSVRVGEREFSVEWRAVGETETIKVVQHTGSRMSYTLRLFKSVFASISAQDHQVSLSDEVRGIREITRLDFALESGGSVEIDLTRAATPLKIAEVE